MENTVLEVVKKFRSWFCADASLYNLAVTMRSFIKVKVAILVSKPTKIKGF